MQLNDTLSVVLALFALMGTVAAPILAFLIARRKVGGEVLLADIEAVKGWSDQRKRFEEEIQQLHEDLISERAKRREERLQYDIEIDSIRTELAVLRAALEECGALVVTE